MVDQGDIQEYILRSWSLVKIGITAGQKKLFFNLRGSKARFGLYCEGDLKPEQVTHIADQLGVTEAGHVDEPAHGNDVR